MQKRIGIGMAAAAAFLLIGGTARAADARAKATIEPKSGSTVTGTATFTEVAGGGVQVVVDVQKAPPAAVASEPTRAAGHRRGRDRRGAGAALAARAGAR